MEFKFDYDLEDDVLSVYNQDYKVKESIEFSEDIVLDLNESGKIIGIEIFYASEFFSAQNKEINKDFLAKLSDAKLEYQDYRNMWFIIVFLKSSGKEVRQSMPPLRKSKYISPLLLAD